ncbi:hypothetical protein AAFC00_002584 [Neodothiora populina]|uniref:Pentatricopeptide repeat-containing protein n=1 Tax=Neodothiora populina TaxID=2781224 RepID=A0ABR3P8Y4_9PEZI
MYLFGSFPRSSSTTTIPLYTKTAIGKVMTVLCPQLQPPQQSLLTPPHPHAHAQRKSSRHSRSHHTHAHPHAHTHTHTHTRTRRACPPSALLPQAAEDLFLLALARASLCRKHSRPFSTQSPRAASQSRPCISPPKHLLPSDTPQRLSRFSTSHGTSNTASAASTWSREELRDIVDLYSIDSDPWDQPKPKSRPTQSRTPLPVPVHDIPPAPNHYRPADTVAAVPVPVAPASVATISASAVASTKHQPRRKLPADAPHYRDQIGRVESLLQNHETPHDLLFDAYQALPHPRISYLSDGQIRKLMLHFSIVEYKSEASMLQYLSLVDDLTAADIPLTINEWNSAIAFAGRWVRRVTDDQVETATQIWLRMEREADVRSDNVTFNILFDVAARAGKFALAEMIMREMLARNMPENRYFRTNKIFYYGLRHDGTAVRQAYKELVDAGCFVDTAVLNCVIASLIKSGEASAAEHIFDRMKAMHDDHTPGTPAVRSWRKQRNLARVLDKAAQLLREDPERRAQVQEATPITPNLNTYRLLIKYHALESGNIDRVTELLDELHQMRIHMHGSVFYHLFRGFHLHGGVRYSSWTKSRLDQLWAVFSEFVQRTDERNQDHHGITYEEDRGCYYDCGIVIAVLRAYNKVAGKDAAMDVWDEVLDKWKPEHDALDEVNRALANMFN